jgi:hypothetical protein
MVAFFRVAPDWVRFPFVEALLGVYLIRSNVAVFSLWLVKRIATFTLLRTLPIRHDHERLTMAAHHGNLPFTFLLLLGVFRTRRRPRLNALSFTHGQGRNHILLCGLLRCPLNNWGCFMLFEFLLMRSWFFFRESLTLLIVISFFGVRAFSSVLARPFPFGTVVVVVVVIIVVLVVATVAVISSTRLPLFSVIALVSATFIFVGLLEKIKFVMLRRLFDTTIVV